MPANVPGSGSTALAVTFATATPDLARPSRFTCSSCDGVMNLFSRRFRTINPAGIAAPCVAGTTQRRCGPPGPLKLPRSIMSQGPAATRRYGMTYGLLLRSGRRNIRCPISCVMVPEFSPCRMEESPHCWAPASQLVQGTYRVGIQRGFSGFGLPHSAGMSSFELNFISPNSCQTPVSSYDAYSRRIASNSLRTSFPIAALQIASQSGSILADALLPSGVESFWPYSARPYTHSGFGMRYGPNATTSVMPALPLDCSIRYPVIVWP